MDGGQTRTPNGAARPAAKPPQGLSAAALDKKLNLKRRAREDAARNLPRHDSDDLSAAELAVIEAVAGERAKVDQARNDAKADAERRLRTLAPTPQDFTGPALDARLALKQTAGRLAHDWSEATARAAQGRGDLDAFKRANELRRGAVYPKSTLLQSGLLFCAAVFEALFSAALFAEDDARGLLGGAITAIGLSGANVTLGYLAGFLGLRYLQHIKLPIKVTGALAFAALAFLALMLNLFAADWRDQLAAAAGRQIDLGADASFHLWSLLQLESPQSIILLMLGAGVWVFAALKGYSGFEDPYPDYGKMDRAARDATDQLSDFRADARLELEAPVNAARTALAARMEKMRAEYEAMNKAFDTAAAKMEALDAKARALDQAAADAIYLYRQENTALRTAPAPAYFGAQPPAAGPALDALGPAAAMIDDARARLSEAQAQSTRALEDLLNDLDAATTRLDQGARCIRRGRGTGARNALGLVLIGVAMLVLGGLAGASFLLRAPPTDAETLCRTDAALGAHTIILVDATDRLEARHRRKLRAVLAQERGRLAQFDRLTIMRLNVRRPQEPAILFSKCLPRPPEQTNPLFENARIVQQQWDEDFAQALDSALRSAGSSGPARASPILAGVRAIAADPDFGAEIPRRRLVLVSDLLEHDPEGFSLYVSDADYAAWRTASPSGPPDLARVDLRVVPIDRPDHAARQAYAVEYFWPAFFDAADAQSVSIDPAP